MGAFDPLGYQTSIGCAIDRSRPSDNAGLRSGLLGGRADPLVSLGRIVGL